MAKIMSSICRCKFFIQNLTIRNCRQVGMFLAESGLDGNVLLELIRSVSYDPFLSIVLVDILVIDYRVQIQQESLDNFVNVLWHRLSVDERSSVLHFSWWICRETISPQVEDFVVQPVIYLCDLWV